ncbi:MAG: hypothetical protein KDA85_01945, partial [Planctomycetaceae bacterium]|nr:hypothetical protein [Planctomycetaceae bacterium]
MSAPETSQLSQQSPRDVYRERLTRTQQSLDAIQRQDRQFVRIRIGLFAAVLLTGLACLGSESIGWSWLFLPLALFVGQLPLHARVIRRQGTLERIRQFYQSCLDRLDRRWINQRQDGREFLQIDHPWALDLDVFGHGSLFQLLNECRTGPGRRELANWLTTVPDATVIRQRQGRSQAMKFNLELREKLAQICDMADWSKAEQMLQEWAQRPLRMIPFWIVACSCLLGIIAVPIVILITLGILPFSAILLLLVLQMPLMALSREQISETTSEMDSVDTALQQLSQVTRIFEQEYFTDPDLLQLQSHLAGVEGPTYQAIERLSRLTGWLNDSVRNQFFAPIAWVCGLLVLLTWLLERWKQQHGNDVERWLATAARFEATVSVAAFAFEHREYCLPEISVAAPEFTAVRLGHALLPPSECVRNDVSLTADHPLILISGSNMSGKSTLLRSIGSNVVLAFCGAVTC